MAADQAWQNQTCGNNPNLLLPTPNSQPACNGAVLVGSNIAGYPTYPGLGTGYTAGNTTPLVYQGSLIPASAVSSYLLPGQYGYVELDWPRFAKDSGYSDIINDASNNITTVGANGGYIKEVVTGGYIQADGELSVFSRPLRYNVGVRYVHTKQTIGGNVGIPDPRNSPAAPAVAPADGGRYPNINSFSIIKTDYSNVLPAMNLVYEATDTLLLRAAASRTMTRANPASLLPGTGFGSPSADIAGSGNPGLKPYISRNIDLGLEYYPDKGMMLGLALFQKEISGFTQSATSVVPFRSLAPFGITYDNLTATQQTSINLRGGPDAATVLLTTTVNAPGRVKIRGAELSWVQPLDMLLGKIGLYGFGFNANGTLIDQKTSGGLPPLATGVPSKSANLTFFYERNGMSLRLSSNYIGDTRTGGFGDSGIALAAQHAYARNQIDFSSSFELGQIFDNKSLDAIQLTFNATNLTNKPVALYYQFSNAPFSYYKPDRTFMIGIRAKLK